MGAFDAMTNAQLREECSQRSLPVSGTNPELIARLEEYDDDQLLQGLTGDAPKVDTAAVVEAPSVDKTAAEPPPPPPPGRPTRATTFVTRFECPGELSSGVHQENLQRIYSEAVAAGHTPRGGAYGGHRTGFTVDGGRRYAVYEINIRRQG